MSKPKIPTTDSIQELAEFWDNHDVTDFEAELEEVPNDVFNRKDVLKVPLTTLDMVALKELARSKDVAISELVRNWVVERLRAS